MEIKDLPPTELISLKRYFESKFENLNPRYWDSEKRAMEVVKEIETILDEMGQRLITIRCNDKTIESYE
jgi:hypothetical protein